MKKSQRQKNPDLREELEPFSFEDHSDQPPPLFFPSSEPDWSDTYSFFIQGPVNEIGGQEGNGPVLQITNGSGTLRPFADIHVLAAMCHPRDTTARNELLVTVKAVEVSETLKNRIQGSISRIALDCLIACLVAKEISEEGGITTLVEAHGLNAVLNELRQSRKRGQIAGVVLVKIARMLSLQTSDSTSPVAAYNAQGQQFDVFPSPLGASVFRPCKKPLASVKKAAFLVGQELITLQNEMDIPTSPRRIQGIWEEYKPVAHLWAASCLWEWDKVTPFHSQETLLTFLAQAEIFRQFGLLYYPPGQSCPLLNSHEVWRLPIDLVLPETQVTMASLTGYEISLLQRKFLVRETS